MPYISEITLPSGSVYSIKDQEARDLIASIHKWDYIISEDAATTPYGVTWEDEGVTITGTLVASDDTMYKIYLVKATAAAHNVYAEYITIKKEVSPTTDPPTYTYSWEKFGSVELPDLTQYVKNKAGHEGDTAGDLAYKNTATGSYTPSGTVSQPTFTGSEETINVSGTAAAQTFTGSPVSYTPSGTVAIDTAGGTTTINNPTANTVVTDMNVANPSATTPIGELVYCSVANENLSFKKFVETTGDSISTTSTTVKTSDATYSFTGTASNITAEGTNSASTVSASGTSTPSGTVSQPTFSGTADTVTVS